MMSEVVEWMWICTGGYGWLRAKWVNSAVVTKLAISTLKVTVFVYQEGLLSFLGIHVR